MTTLTVADLVVIAKGPRSRLRQFRRVQCEVRHLRTENRAMSDLLREFMGEHAFREYQRGLQQSMK